MTAEVAVIGAGVSGASISCQLAPSIDRVALETGSGQPTEVFNIDRGSLGAALETVLA